MMKKPYQKESRYVSALCVWVPDVRALLEGCRYDSCYPASEEETRKIERLLGGHRSTAADHVVRLTRVARNDLPPTLDRWRSFASCVLDVRHPSEAPLTDAELARLVELHVDLGLRTRRPG